jgi:putative SOS response-associated peptidase YedK
MCGRFSLSIPMRDLLDYFGLSEAPALELRYNIAPSQMIPAVRVDGEKGERRLVFFRWGLIPSWAKDEKIGYRTINARAESVARLPSFRSAFRGQRCLIPADGFYEWRKTGRKKQGFHIRREDLRPLALAGLWERWDDPKQAGTIIESCTIITTEANDQVQSIHERMPVILEPRQFDLWLDPNCRDYRELQNMLRPFNGGLAIHLVGDYVHRVGNEGPECLARVEREASLFEEIED